MADGKQRLIGRVHHASTKREASRGARRIFAVVSRFGRKSCICSNLGKQSADARRRTCHRRSWCAQRSALCGRRICEPVEAYDFATDTWSLKTPLTFARRVSENGKCQGYRPCLWYLPIFL